MHYLSICSGIEAASVAWRPLGWTPRAFAETGPFASAVLVHHYPRVPNLGDVNVHAHWPAAAVDVLVGGPPCQSFSIAGLRKGMDDPRGNLTLVMLAVARQYAPRWLLFENVSGVLSSNGGRDFGTFLGGLADLGYGFAWRVLDAQYFGLAQRRRRVFVVGCAGDWRAAAAVLLERHCLLGHPAPRREARQALASTPGARTRSGGGLGTDAECDGALIPGIARSLTSSNERIDAETETLVVAPPLTTRPWGDNASREELLVTHALRADGFDASEDGTGRGTPLIAMPFDTTQITSPGNYSRPRPGDPCHPLAAGACAPGIACAAPVIGFDCKASHRHGVHAGDIAPTLRGMGHSGSHANGGGQVAVLAIRGRADGRHLEVRSDGTANALITPNGGRDGLGIGALMTPEMQVRRLTPRECERLMGFPDDYTLIPFRGRPAADGPRYRALGNSIAVPVLAWIARRIEAVEAIRAGESS